jgi:hypothetical protein
VRICIAMDQQHTETLLVYIGDAACVYVVCKRDRVCAVYVEWRKCRPHLKGIHADENDSFVMYRIQLHVVTQKERKKQQNTYFIFFDLHSAYVCKW